MVTEAWVPERLGVNVSAGALRKKALYELLLEQGIQFGRVVQEITAQSADPQLASLLDVPAGAPLLVVVRLIHDRQAQPVQYLRVYLSAERSRILMDIAGSDLNTLKSGQIVHDSARRKP
jgi:GntR family transcriptional regulator